MKARYGHYALAEILAATLPAAAVRPAVRAFAGAYAFFSKDRRIVSSNLRAALPTAGEKEIERRTRELIFNYSRYLTDLFYWRLFSKKFVLRHAAISGLDRLDRALSEGKGAVIVSAHVGNWEMGALTLSHLGYPVNVIAARHADPRVERIFAKRRARSGVNVIHVGGSLKGIYRAVRQNGILALNGDRLYGKDGVPVRFMGADTRFPEGFARIHAETGAPVLPAFFLYNDEGGKSRYLMQVGAPLSGSGVGTVQAFASAAEAVIRRHPAQWFIFQPFTEAAAWPV